MFNTRQAISGLRKEILNSAVRPQMRQDRQCTYTVKRMCVRATIVTVEKQ